MLKADADVSSMNMLNDKTRGLLDENETSPYKFKIIKLFCEDDL